MVRIFGIGSKLLNDVLGDYDSLLSARNAIGYTVENPQTSTMPIESVGEMKEIDDTVRMVQNTRLGKTGIHGSLVNLFRKDNGDLLDGLRRDIRNTVTAYSHRTMMRNPYGLLAPLALCSYEEIPKHMGAPDCPEILDMTWTLHFQQLTTGEHGIGLLDATGITLDGIKEWWSNLNECQSLEEESYVWMDVKAISLRLVVLLDDGLEDIDSTTLVDRINGCRGRLKRLSLSLSRLVYLQRDDHEEIRSLFELFVPLVYSFLVSRKDESARSEAMVFLETYITLLEAMRNDVIHHLAITDTMKRFEELDNLPLDKSKDNEHRQKSELTVLCQEAITRLAKLGIPRLQLNLQVKRESIGDGSFATVYRYDSDYGSVAAKIFKRRKDNARTRDRLLREAERWSELRHRHINTFLGFAIDPDEVLPCLISTVCKTTLADYIGENPGAISSAEKLRYLKEVGEALQYMHGIRVAHGDLRLPNVMLAPGHLGSEYIVKLIDFGVAYSEDKPSNATTTQHTNEAYLAPELKLPKSSKKDAPRRVTIEGDLYAFGCCFLEAYYELHMDTKTIKKLKKSGKCNGLGPKLPNDAPPGQKYIHLNHWKFLELAWDDNGGSRPSAQVLIEYMLSFLNY